MIIIFIPLCFLSAYFIFSSSVFHFESCGSCEHSSLSSSSVSFSFLSIFSCILISMKLPSTVKFDRLTVIRSSAKWFPKHGRNNYFRAIFCFFSPRGTNKRVLRYSSLNVRVLCLLSSVFVRLILSLHWKDIKRNQQEK